jgi:hypothetical protein
LIIVNTRTRAGTNSLKEEQNLIKSLFLRELIDIDFIIEVISTVNYNVKIQQKAEGPKTKLEKFNCLKAEIKLM